MPLAKHPNLTSPFNAYLESGAWDRYLHELQDTGLLWLIRGDWPRLVYHLMPLNSRPRDLDLPLRLQFLSDAAEPSISLDRIKHYLDLFLEKGDMEAAFAANAFAIFIIHNQGNDFAQFEPWYDGIDELLAGDHTVAPQFKAVIHIAKGLVELSGFFRLSAARESLIEALHWAEAPGDAALTLAATAVMGATLIQLADFKYLCMLINNAAPLLDMPEVPFEAVAAFSGLSAMVTGLMGDATRSAELLGEIVYDPDFKCVSPSNWLQVQGNLMYNAIQTGDDEQAARIAKSMREFAIPEGNHFFYAYTHFNLALEANAKEDWSAARINVEEAVRRLEAAGAEHNTYMTKLMLAHGMVENGHADHAIAFLEQLKADSAAKENHYVTAGAELELAAIRVNQHDLDQAREHYKRAKEIYHGLDPIHPTRLRSFERDLRRILFPETVALSNGEASLAYPININTLGDFRIQYGGSSIDSRSWHGRQTKALLLALITFGGSVSAEKLMDILWPDAEADKASQNLKATIFRLKQVLKKDDSDAPPWITVQNKRVAINRELCSVDALRFLRALSQALQSGNGVTVLREALDLYIGDFMPQSDSETFVVNFRQDLRKNYVSGVKALAQRCLERDKAELVLPYLDIAAKCDPLDEGLCEQAMKVHLHRGRSAKALQAYEKVRQALMEKLGIEPGIALRSMAERLRPPE
jgi:DNA-binding SARP family transcriptional activator